MKEEKNITHNDMRFFQNDLLNDMKKLELQLNGKVTGINQILLTKISEYDSKFAKISENVTELISQMTERKYDNDRVEELLKMRNKFSDQIMENQSRISIIDKTLENALFKYDKIILDNLNVPGLIGIGSKFKNCASFFKFLENEYQANQKYKEEGIVNFKLLSDKLDLRLKKSEGEITKILQSVNQICDLKFEKIYQKVEEKALNTDNYVALLRIENSKYATDLINATHEVNIQWDKLENIKNEIYDKFNSEVEVCKKLVIATERNFKKQEEEFNIFKQRFSQLAEYLKDVKNLGKNYREMAKNIDFSKKQKLDEDFDQEKYDEIAENLNDYMKYPSPPPRKHRNSVVLKIQDINKIETDDNAEDKRKNNKRSSLSPSPRRTSIHIKKKRMTQMETLNKIAEEGTNRLNNVFKKKMEDLNEQNNGVKKNLNNFYKTDLRKKKNDDMGQDAKKGKSSVKTLLRKKTIVTENNIDLNFNFNKEKGKDSSKEIEEIGNSSSSSNFELSSVISLKKIGDDTKEDKTKPQNKKDFKSKNYKSAEIIRLDKETQNEKNLEKSLENNKSNKSLDSKSSSSYNQEPTISDKEKEEEKEKNKDKEILKLNIPEKKNEKIEKLKINNIQTETNIINNKKKEIYKTPSKSRENTKRIKENELQQNKSQKKVKNQQKNLKLNISKEKSNVIRQSIHKKSNSPRLPKRAINLDPIELKHKKKFQINVPSVHNESQHENSKEKPQKIKPVMVYNKQIKQVMDEYTNKNSNNLKKPLNSKISTEITFPQIKTASTETIKKENSQKKIIKIMNNTQKDNNKIKNKLILGYNKTKPFTFKGLFTSPNQRINTNNNNNINNNENNIENKEIMNTSVDKKEIMEQIEIKEISKDVKDLIINSNQEKEKEEIKDEIIHESKEEKEIKISTEVNEINDNKENGENIDNKENEENKEKEENKENKENKEKEKEKKDDINIKNLFNSLYEEIKEIKAITNKNNLNNEKENIENKNAFLTSLSNINNNNFNYFYNNIPNGNRSNFITIQKEYKKIDDEAIKKINNEIDFINGNIKLVNHKISNLENKYQLILSQLNNIFKTVSSYYHHHKRKSEIHHTFRMKNKLGTNKQKMEQDKIGEILNDKNFMMKIKDIYNDDYENVDEYKLNIPNDEYNKTLRKIEPFLIKKFKKV